MQDKTVPFMMEKFRRYYIKEKIEPPERLSRREFGFMFFDKTFVLRHIGFQTRQELKEYITTNVPAHLYYSSAYYQNPNAQKMVDKKWMGADLVFDLDADHVRDAEGLSYPDMLLRVKREIIRLLDDFITGDLGFDSDNVKIVFSGGRGYHLHVNDPRVVGLGSHERREIVDYITGTDLNFDWAFPSESFDAKKFGQHTQIIYRKNMPGKESGGWKGRMGSGIKRLLTDLEVMGEKEAIIRYAKLRDESSKKAIGEKTVCEMYRELFNPRKGGIRGADRMIRENNFEVFSKQPYLNAFLLLIKNYFEISLVGETDEPVTSDIRRLIRMPSSLHGKTGLRVTRLERDELDDFDPLRDAFPRTLSDRPVKISLGQEFEMRLRGEDFSLKEGETEVPEFAALFLACRKSAKLL